MLAHAAAVAPVVMAVYDTSMRNRYVGNMGGRTCMPLAPLNLAHKTSMITET
jgi:hypothetical protein